MISISDYKSYNITKCLIKTLCILLVMMLMLFVIINYIQEPLYALLLFAAPLLLISCIFLIKYFENIFLFFLLAAPFYYLPTLIIGVKLTGDFGEEGFWLRAVKDVLILILIISWAIRAVLQKKMGLRFNLLTALVITYCLFGFLRSLISSDIVTTLRIFVEFSLIFFIARDIFYKLHRIEKHVFLWVVASAIVSAIGIFEYFAGGIDHAPSKAAGQIRIVSTLFNPNALGWYLTYSSALACGLINAKCMHYKSKLLMPSIIIINIVAIMLTGSRLSLMITGVIIFIAIFSARSSVSVFLAAFVIIMSMIIMMPDNYFTVDQMRVFDIKGSHSPRAEIIALAVQSYFDLPLFQILLGADVSNIDNAKLYGLVFDSQYITTLYYGGVVGLLLLIAIQIAAGIRLLNLALKIDGVFTGLFLVYASISIICVAGNILTVFPHSLFFWIITGIAATVRIPKNRQYAMI